jgi:hypothetical protein
VNVPSSNIGHHSEFPKVSGGEIMRTANTTLNEAEIMQKK